MRRVPTTTLCLSYIHGIVVVLLSADVEDDLLHDVEDGEEEDVDDDEEDVDDEFEDLVAMLCDDEEGVGEEGEEPGGACAAVTTSKASSSSVGDDTTAPPASVGSRRSGRKNTANIKRRRTRECASESKVLQSDLHETDVEDESEDDDDN